MNYSKINPLYVIIIVLIGFIFIREGCNNSKTNNLIKDITEYKTEVKTYKGLNGVEVAQNKALLLENANQIKALFNKNDTMQSLLNKYKDLKSVSVTNNITQIFNDSIIYDSIRIPCDFKPFKVIRDSVNYYFKGTIAPTYFLIDTIKIPDTQSLIFGLRKMGFLKRSEYTAEVIHSNPLVHTTNIGSYSIKEKRKLAVISIGIGYGTSLSNIKLEPNVSIQVGFPLISF